MRGSDELFGRPERRGWKATAAGRRSGRKPLLAPLRGRELNSWYVTAERNAPPLLENDEESQRLERVALAKSAGRAPPKKGQGKRSGGGKKKKVVGAGGNRPGKARRQQMKQRK